MHSSSVTYVMDFREKCRTAEGYCCAFNSL